MIRAYKFLMRPTGGQQGALADMLRDHCSLYNGALQERRAAYRHGSRTTVRYGQQSAQLKDIRAFDPERQGRWSFSSQQATLRRLDKAFAAFFRRVKSGELPGYPRFRSSKRFDTVDFPRDGDGCRWKATPHDPVTRVRLQGVGHVKLHQHRPVVGKVKTISVKREGRRWYIVLTAEQARPDPLPETGAVVGIDMGVANFDGEFVSNPRHGEKTAARLEAAQQALARCKRGSKRRRKAVETVARLHRKVRRRRLDHAHKTALGLVREHDFIAHEDLRIRNMSKAPDPKPDPGQPGRFLPNGGGREGQAEPIDFGCRMGGVPADPHRQGSMGRTGSDGRGPPQHLPAVPRMRAHRQGEPAHPGQVPLSGMRPHRARGHRGRPERSTGRAGPSRSHTGIARSPLIH